MNTHIRNSTVALGLGVLTGCSSLSNLPLVGGLVPGQEPMMHDVYVGEVYESAPIMAAPAQIENSPKRLPNPEDEEAPEPNRIEPEGASRQTPFKPVSRRN